MPLVILFLKEDFFWKILKRFFFSERKSIFAGEATSPKYLSTVHGAYISGMEAVKDIIAALEDE